MEIVFDTKQLLSLLKDFNTITNVRVGVYDCNFQEICAYPPHPSSFCKIIRSKEKGLKLCKSCDRHAFSHAKATQNIYIYKCHTGLTEAVSPILDQNITIGYLMIGQMRSEGNADEQWKNLIKYFSNFDMDISHLKSAFYKLNCVSEEKITAYAHILQACAISIRYNNYIRVQDEDIIKKLDCYINKHINEHLSLDILSKNLNIGKTTLCTYAKKHFGMSINTIIRKRRIIKAKELLQRTNKPIAVIANEVGIPDYNYFTKIFKSEVGTTPTTYRKWLHSNN